MKNTYMYRINEDGTRTEIWGIPSIGWKSVPVKGASFWKWSDGSFCY